VFILPRVKAIRGALPEGSAALPANATALSLRPGTAHAHPRPRDARARHRLSNDREAPTLFFLRCSSSEAAIVLGVARLRSHIFQNQKSVVRGSMAAKKAFFRG